MITKTETDELFDRFVADNTKYDNDRKRVLNNLDFLKYCKYKNSIKKSYPPLGKPENLA